MSREPFLWDQANGMQGLFSNYTPAIFATAEDVNNFGMVTGEISQSDGSFYYRATLSDGVQLVPLPQGTGVAWGPSLNDAGTVAGTLWVRSAQNEVEQRPYVFGTGGSTQALYLPEGMQGRTQAINNSGMVAGIISEDLDLQYDTEPDFAAVWMAGAITILAPREAGQSMSAVDLNDSGLVVGYSGNDSTRGRMFLWDAVNGRRDIDVIPQLASGTEGLFPAAINNHGIVTGFYYGEDGSIGNYLYDETNGFRLVEDLLAPGSPNFDYLVVTDINDQGWMSAVGFSGAQSQALLLRPVPEPATLTALGLGAAVLLQRRRT